MVTKVKRVTGGGAGVPVQQQRAAGHSLPALEQRAGHAQQGRAERVCSAAHPGGRLQGPCQWSCCTPVSLKKCCNIFKDCQVLCGQQLRVHARLTEVIAGCQQQRQTCLRAAGARKRRGPGPGTAPGCSHRRGDAAHRQQQNAQGVPETQPWHDAVKLLQGAPKRREVTKLWSYLLLKLDKALKNSSEHHGCLCA